MDGGLGTGNHGPAPPNMSEISLSALAPGLPQRRRNMRLLRYKSKFSSTIHKLVRKGNVGFPKLCEQLKVLEPLVSVDMFIYDSVKDQREGKRALLELWRHLMTLADHVPAYRQNLFYSMIFYIVTRYEFDLIHLTNPMKQRKHQRGVGAFKSSHKEIGLPSASQVASSVASNSEDVIILKEYRDLLVHQIQLVLRLFKSKQLSKVLKKFCSQLLSVAYFRIPVLSGVLMASCCEVARPSCKLASERHALWFNRGRTPEWVFQLESEVMRNFDSFVTASTQLEVSDKLNTSEFFDFNPTLFHWTLFVENDDRIVLGNLECLSKLNDDKYFFRFISRLVAHVNDVLHKPWVTHQDELDFDVDQLGLSAEQEEDLYMYQMDRSISWGLVPGYWSFVRSVLTRSLVPLDLYRSDLKRCVLRILANPDLLGIFTKAYLLSTSVSRKHEINACMDQLDSAFDAACGANLGDPLPETFCFDFFFSAISVLLESEQFEVLLKVLCFLYTHLGRFHGTERIRLVQDMLIHRYFFKFFLHWYPSVRRQYHHILVYKLDRVGHSRAPEPDQVSESTTSKKSSWIRRVGSKITRVFIDEDSVHHDRPSFSSEVGSSHSISSEEVLNITQTAKKDLYCDPPIDACEHIITKDCEDVIEQDRVIDDNLQIYLQMLERQAADPAQDYFPPSMTVYVEESMNQYHRLKASKRRVQKLRMLQKYEVLAPSTYYDIPKDPRDIG